MKALLVALAILLSSASAVAANCVVSETVLMPDGTPVPNVRVEFHTVQPQSVNNSLLSDKPAVGITDVNGQVSVTLLQGATVRVNSPRLGFTTQRILVPNTATANLRTLVANYMAQATLPAVNDATDLVMGVADSGLTEITTGQTIASAIVALNQTAGSGGGGGSVPDATTTVKGKVELATDGENLANVVVQGNDSRLSNARTPTMHASTHSSGQSDPVSHNNLAGLTTGDPHTQYILDIERGASSGVATLDSGTKVPVAQLPSATTSTAGVCELATDGESASGVVVQGSDARLSDARTPTAHQSSHQSGNSDALSGNLDANSRVAVRVNSTGTPSVRRRINFIAGANVTITPSDDGVNEEVDLTIASAGGGGGGSLADGDYGDITVSGTGTALTIDNDSVTYAKIQNVSATDKLLGRFTAGAGDIEELTCSDFAQSLLDDADATAARTTLGLGTLATQNGTFSGTSSGTNTGDQTITLTGNVTGSGTGSFAATIANNAVTYAKMQDISATDRLLGRATAGAGDPEEITCTPFARSILDDADAATVRATIGAASGSGSASGTNTGDQTITLTSDVTGSGTGSFATTIAAGAVTLAKMANLAQDQVIGRVTASTGVPETFTVTAAARTVLDDTSVANMRTTLGAAGGTGTANGTNTGDQTITLTSDVTGSGTGSFATTIANDAVTFAKMQNIATDKLIGRVSALTGDPEEVTCTDFAQSLLDDADATAARSTLGLGTLATQSGTFSGTSSGTNTGDQTITLTGDVTGSGTGSFAATIANNSVSLAKLADVATDVLLGRTTAATGDPEAISITDFFQTLFDDVDAAAMRSTLGLGTAATTNSTAYEVPLTFSTGLTRSTNTVTVNTTQNIAKLSNLTSNGCVQTSGSDGTLSITSCGGGGLSDGDKGDITVGSSGTTLTIDNDAVTYAKIQNVSATDKLLGRFSASAGDIEEITCSDFVQSLLDDADAATARATLGIPLWYKDYMADQLIAVGSGWPTTTMADLETVNLVNVIAYDPSTSQGRGLEIVLPTGATTITLDIDAAAAASGFTSNNGIVMALDCRQQYGTGSFTQQAATAVTITDNATIQRKTFAYTLSGLSLTAGTVALCELERLTANASDTMTKDWRVAHIAVTVN